MLTTAGVREAVRRSAHAFRSDERRRLLEEEAAGHGAGPDDLVAAAVAGMESDDRNVRVAMLRVLALYPDPRATDAVLLALSDPARRVREVAMKSARPHHVASAALVARLREIAEDDSETNRLRHNAFFVLSSSFILSPSATSATVAEAVQQTLLSLMDAERFRRPILIRLCKTANHTPASREILHEFVRSGTKDEAVMATRALAGQMLVRIDGWLPPEERRRVRETYDPAPGAPASAATIAGPPVHSCWIPRDEAVALARSVDYPSVP